jgi:acyl-CoA synthetase (NDP forming)
MTSSIAHPGTQIEDRLGPLLGARSLALIGASSNPNKLSGRTLRFLQQQQFTGEIYPINFTRAEIDGVRCYKTIRDIGRPVDLGLILTPARDALDALREGAEAGMRSFIVSASGFAEAGGEGVRLQTEISDFARAQNIRVLGPNCVGVINSRSRLMATFSGVGERLKIIEGGFSFASQSGAMAAYWLENVTNRGLGFAKWISTGNEADLTISDAIVHFALDPDTRVIGLYLEGVQDGAKLRAALMLAHQMGKPVLVLKAGATKAGADAALSHTGAIAGADAVWNALFEQCGVVRCQSLTQMVSFAKLPLMQPGATGSRPAIVSVSGGAGALLTDEAVLAHFEVKDFTGTTKEKLTKALPEFASPRNPIDVTGAASPRPEIFSNTLEAIFEDEEHDSVIVFLSLSRPGVADNFVKALLTCGDRRGKPFLIVSLGTTPELRDKLESVSIPVFDDIPEVIGALRAATMMHASMAPSAEQSYAIVPRSASVGATALAEFAAREVIGSDWPFEWPKQVLVADAGQLHALLSGLRLPAVAKLQSAQLLHKTEHGAVMLGLADPDAVERAVAELFKKARDMNISCDGILLQEMMHFEHELLLGLRQDPVFGPLLVIGRGGADVEADPDSVILLLPADAAAVERALRRVRYAKVLEHGRGRAPVDLGKLAVKIASFASWYCSRADVLEVEINPLAIGRGGQVAGLDALMSVARTATSGIPPIP